jgi:acetyltransferase-like isoleucine patch superfamily enzyme
MPRQVTLSFEKLTGTLQNVVYIPHPEIHVGNLLIPMNKRIGGASTLFVAHTAKIDITADVTLCEWCMIGHGAELWTHTHNHSLVPVDIPTLRFQEECGSVFTTFLPKVIEEDVWIYNAVVLPRCTSIAKGSVIATGAIVTKPIVEPYGIWAGIPARRIGTRGSSIDTNNTIKE